MLQRGGQVDLLKCCLIDEAGGIDAAPVPDLIRIALGYAANIVQLCPDHIRVDVELCSEGFNIAVVIGCGKQIDPGREALRLLNLVQMLRQGEKDILDISSA